MTEQINTDTICIYLDAVRVYRNKSEYRTTQRARSSLGHEITGDGPIVSKLASILRRDNPHFNGLLEVFRGDTPCFNPMPLKTAFIKGSAQSTCEGSTGLERGGVVQSLESFDL